jgi:hypothetical protein
MFRKVEKVPKESKSATGLPGLKHNKLGVRY